MKKIKKLVISLLCIMFVVGLIPNNVFAVSNTSTEEKIESLKTDSSQYGKMVEVEDGLYIITIPITESSSSVSQSKSTVNNNLLNSSSELFAGVLQVYMQQNDTISNMYSLSYMVTANSYFNGVLGSFSVTSTSILNPKTYFSTSMDSPTIPATMTYIKPMGSVILPYNDSSVRLKASGVKVYSLSLASWVSGLTYNKVFKY